MDLSAWSEISPKVEALLEEPFQSDSVPQRLREWSDLYEQIRESAALTSIEYSRDTADEERKAQYLYLINEVYPDLSVFGNRFQEKLLASGWEGESMREVIKRFRIQVEIFRPENVELEATEQTDSAKYSEIVGGTSVKFNGEEVTLPQIRKHLESQDRSVRSQAWGASMSAFLEVREELDSLYSSLFETRQTIARNAGFDNYRDYRWQELGRVDYTPENATQFQNAIREAVVPAMQRRIAKRAKMLRLESVRPWDIDVDIHGDEALRPFENGMELARGSARIFDQVDPILGERIRAMEAGQLLDLDNRKGKAPGGYCSTLPARGMPFIFMNSVGTDDNLRTMLHEAGHAFHVFETTSLPLIWERRAPMEFCEVASMSMELLASPYITSDEGGFYSSLEATRSRIHHLERMLYFLPYMAVVSAFQHWVYCNPGHGPADRDAKWFELHSDYCRDIDWSGHEDSRHSLWHQKLHIFRAPFYYIEYGIAQMGALQVWRNSMHDPKKALEQYRQALALGGTKNLAELFAAAGAELRFDTESVAELVELIENEIGSLENSL